ncbi:MAG TPA: DUF4382 domain-containing protein [Gemmatimonadaceae bacterium]|nr:DUF4382 domain-containing protein [Gemmatimonadaceae bacterium]
MTRSSYLRAAALLSTAAFAVACSSSSPASPSGTGTVAVRLTDAPFLTDSVQSVDVFVIRVDGRVADADSATAARGASDDSATVGGWTTLATPNTSVNLLAYQNGAALALGSATMPAGNYSGFRLVIDPTRSSVTLKNGMKLTGLSTPGVMFPSASRSGIKIVLAQPVTVTADQTTTVLVDFMVDSSFVMRGATIMQNGLLFKPVIHASMQ